MNKAPISNTRRKIIKASAASFIFPSATYAAGEGEAKAPRRTHRYGILGQRAPELEVKKWIDGKGKEASFKMSDHEGKFVYLKFWQYWCPGCHSHGLPALKKVSNAFKDSPHFTAASIQTVFEGSFVNTASKMDNIQDKYDLHHLVMGHDSGKDHPSGHPSTMRNYRSGGTPWTVVVAPDRSVIFNDFSINADAAIDYLKKEIAKMS